MSSDSDASEDSERTEAFIRLLAEHERKLGRYAMMLVPHVHDADEIMQESKMVMWRSFDRFELGTDFSAWARKVVFHQVLKYRRQPARRTQPFSDQTLELLASETLSMETQLDQRHRILADCIAKLSDEHRKILRLRYNDELSIERIAEQVDRTTAAVYRVLSRIRRTLHGCVSDSVKVGSES